MCRADSTSLRKDKSVLISSDFSRNPSIFFGFIYDFFLSFTAADLKLGNFFFLIFIRASTSSYITLLNDLHNLKLIRFIHSPDHIVFKSEFLTERDLMLPFSISKLVKGKAIPFQALTGPEGSRRVRLPDFKTVDTSRW